MKDEKAAGGRSQTATGVTNTEAEDGATCRRLLPATPIPCMASEFFAVACGSEPPGCRSCRTGGLLHGFRLRIEHDGALASAISVETLRFPLSTCMEAGRPAGGHRRLSAGGKPDGI